MRAVFIMCSITPILWAASYSLEGGIRTTAYDYTETFNSRILDTETSNVGEILGGYIRFTGILREDEQSQDALELYGMRTEGDTQYIGSLIGSGEGYGSFRSITANTYNDVQLNYTRRYPNGYFGHLIKVGLGYYEWERTLSRAQVEVYHWYYAQVALGIDKTFASGWNVGLELAGRYAFDQKMDADIPDNRYVTFDLGNVYTIQVNLPVTVPVNDTISVVGGVEFDHTDIGKSNIIDGFFEPDSIQNNWHLYAGIKLYF